MKFKHIQTQLISYSVEIIHRHVNLTNIPILCWIHTKKWKHKTRFAKSQQQHGNIIKIPLSVNSFNNIKQINLFEMFEEKKKHLFRKYHYIRHK